MDIAHCTDLPVSLVFLPAADIATYVGEGDVDLGITGEDIVAESEVDVKELMKLGMGKCRLCVQAPKGAWSAPAQLAGQRIVTSFPNLTKRYFAELEVPGAPPTSIKCISGSVEAACGLGLADERACAHLCAGCRGEPLVTVASGGSAFACRDAACATRRQRPHSFWAALAATLRLLSFGRFCNSSARHLIRGLKEVRAERRGDGSGGRGDAVRILAVYRSSRARLRTSIESLRRCWSGSISGCAHL